MRQIGDWLSAGFLDFRIERRRALLFRFFFFMVLAFDSWLNIAHAPRYGVADFNVSHFPWLDGALPVPGRMVMTLLWMVQSYLAVRIAIGGATRWLPWMLTALYGFTYFISQLDSYQHHYLVFLALVILSPLRWDEQDAELSGWPFRLLLAQVSIVYVWAVIAKGTLLWWDGTLLLQQVGQSEFLLGIARFFGLTITTLCKVMAVATVLVEVALAVVIHVRRFWPVACAVGIVFHVTIEWAGFKIGLFSYFMIAVYLLLLPSFVFQSALGTWSPKWPLLSQNRAITVLAAALAVGAGCLLLVPLEGQVGVVIAVSFLAVVLQTEKNVGPPVLSQHASHAVACVVILLLYATTDVVFDYYRFLGGDARRRDDVKTAIFAYERSVDIDPTYAPAFRKLGELYERDGQWERAQQALRRADQLAPVDAPGPRR